MFNKCIHHTEIHLPFDTYLGVEKGKKKGTQLFVIPAIAIDFEPKERFSHVCHTFNA